MATANVPVSGEGMQAPACPCGSKISSWDTHQMCVMCLGLKHAQATLESSEECTHCAQFSLKVLLHRLAWQELDEAYLPVGPSCHLVDRDEVDSDGGSELLISDEYEEDDSPLALSGNQQQSRLLMQTGTCVPP
ncbi:hypothetical protein LDENG_00223750 [Lucifuga dentata]|nr:hypothetical protein LDENG_00223750 [Lucifuga dentata]